jgi:predicted phosphodiesterase
VNEIAVITDIHANLPALQAALARIDELGIERIYCGGDLVGYGPHPNEVCALLAERQIPTIYGNYDYAIARDLDDCGCAYIDRRDRDLGQKSVEWTLAHTDRPAKDFMRELQFDLHFELADRLVHLVHGSPRKVNEYLFEDKPASLYERLADAERELPFEDVRDLLDAGRRRDLRALGLRRSAAGIDSRATPFASVAISFSRKRAMRSSSRRISRASLAVSLSPTASASASMPV